jgi:hypothetical protein
MVQKGTRVHAPEARFVAYLEPQRLQALYNELIIALSDIKG